MFFSFFTALPIWGTLVNTAGIIVGSLAGVGLKSGLKEQYKNIINQGTGLAILFVGAASCLSNMLKPNASAVLFIISLAIGGILGEWIGIEARLEKLGDWLQSKIRLPGEMGNISRGFVTASLLYCVGTMAVLGPLESGLQGQHSILYAKSLLDMIISVVMASTLGIGVIFSAASVFLYQGLITILALWVSPYLTADMLRELSIVGGILIFSLGLNMLEMTKIKVGNLLPSILVPVIWYFILGLFR